MRFVGRRVVPGAVPDTDPCPTAGRFAANYQVPIGLDDGLLRCHCSSQKRCRRNGYVDRLAAFTFVASLIAAAAQQQEIPRFRSGVDIVQFTVTVLDKDRHPVTGLTASDFDVLVDGKPRLLAAFAAVTLPPESSVAAAIPRVAADVTTNRLPPEGRLLVIVMDRSIGNGQPMRAARAIANAAIDRLGPFDVGAVVYTASALRMYSQGLTTDRAWLRAAVGHVNVGALEEPPPPPSLADFAASRGATPAPKAQSRVQLTSEEDSGECNCGVCVPDTLTALAKTLTGGTTRHKSILFVGSDLALTSRDTSRLLRRLHLSGARSADAGARRGQRHFSRRRSARTRGARRGGGARGTHRARRYEHRCPAHDDPRHPSRLHGRPRGDQQ